MRRRRRRRGRRRCNWNRSVAVCCSDFRGLFASFDCNCASAQCAKMFIYLFAVCNNLLKKAAAALKCMSCDWVKLLSFRTIAVRLFFARFFCCCLFVFFLLSNSLSFIISLLTRYCLTVAQRLLSSSQSLLLRGSHSQNEYEQAHTPWLNRRAVGYCFRFAI